MIEDTLVSMHLIVVFVGDAASMQGRRNCAKPGDSSLLVCNGFCTRLGETRTALGGDAGCLMIIILVMINDVTDATMCCKRVSTLLLGD